MFVHSDGLETLSIAVQMFVKAVLSPTKAYVKSPQSFFTADALVYSGIVMEAM